LSEINLPKKELAVLYECNIIITILDNSVYHQQLFESFLRPTDISKAGMIKEIDQASSLDPLLTPALDPMLQ